MPGHRGEPADALPADVVAPRGVAVNPAGEYLVVGRISGTFAECGRAAIGGVWDAGVGVPTGELTPQGLGVQVNGGSC